MNNIVKYLLIIAIVGICFLHFQYSYAAPTPTPTSTGGSGSTIPLPTRPPNLPDVNINNLIRTAIQVIFAVGQIAFVIVLLIGGLMFITSAGNQEQAEKAKKLILFAVIGVVVLFSAWGIASFLVTKLQ